MNSIAFIDCYGDLAERFTPEMQKFLPELKVIYGKTLNEKDIIKRIGNHINILVYMAFISKKVLKSCKNHNLGYATLAKVSKILFNMF